MLRGVLAKLYGDEAWIIAHDLGLPITRIAFKGTAQDVWFGVIQATVHQGVLTDLIERSISDYPSCVELNHAVKVVRAALGAANSDTQARMEAEVIERLCLERAAKGQSLLAALKATKERFSDCDSPHGFDVFVSYADQDTAMAQQLVEFWRKGAGVTICMDRNTAESGDSFLQSIADSIHEARFFILLVGRKGISTLQFTELALAAQKAESSKRFRVLPVLLPHIESTEAFNEAPFGYPPVSFRNGMDVEAHCKVVQTIFETIGTSIADLPRPIGASPRFQILRYDAFIACGSNDMKYGAFFAEMLRGAGLDVWDEGCIEFGTDAESARSMAFAASASCILLIGNSTQCWQTYEIGQHIRDCLTLLRGTCG
jgi:TIR domain